MVNNLIWCTSKYICTAIWLTDLPGATLVYKLILESHATLVTQCVQSDWGYFFMWTEQKFDKSLINHGQLHCQKYIRFINLVSYIGWRKTTDLSLVQLFSLKSICYHINQKVRQILIKTKY